jgi:large subunit ribosomal protein L14
MVFNESRLSVLDNSGALVVKCFRVYGRPYGIVGTKIIVSVQTFRTGKKVKKGEIFKAIIVNTKSSFRRKTGNYLKFDHNGVVLWKRKEESPVATRIRYSVPIELRFLGYMKIVLLSSGTY